jgi:hypothetical protein
MLFIFIGAFLIIVGLSGAIFVSIYTYYEDRIKFWFEHQKWLQQEKKRRIRERGKEIYKKKKKEWK